MGKEYTTYETLQRQRQLETRARKYREDVHLLEQGMEGVSEEESAKIKDTITLTKARYQGTLQEYQAFSKKMDLPMQKERIYQDGLKVNMGAPKGEKVFDNRDSEGLAKANALFVNKNERLFKNAKNLKSFQIMKISRVMLRQMFFKLI